MGYTHYWQKTGDEISELNLRHAIRVMARIVTDNKERLANGAGEEGTEPDIWVDDTYPLIEDKNTNGLVRLATSQETCTQEEYVCFNGIGDDMHETFVISSEWKGEYQFCKTSRFSYDDVVLACLVVLQYFMGESVEVSTDGAFIDKEGNKHLDMDQLKPGIELALKYLPAIIPERKALTAEEDIVETFASKSDYLKQ